MKINWKTGIVALATFASLTPMSSVLAQEFNDKAIPESKNIIYSSTSSNNLDGTWDYQVSLPQSQCYVLGACSIKIVGSNGHYVLPINTDNKNGVFVVNVYPTTINRGLPVVTITGIGVTGQEITYTIVHSGRLDQPGLITGRFVDVENNQGTFTLKKQ
ncbi:hypothetical protein [Nostoc sp. 'Lobaria pulmonaria (5183) cyanobiont']|uniref:hypothetical protein n=1 Tax=Nostoc sp. 'Lobaria pulmonaria (5183) cyanobiont' TaxID=1618022 RepID=UPI000CF339D3|nr:hypothetical protein [Nostoc sp. 'Lobaria pulmonaria (5183) cyanobiont']AVH70782.1 hypothetical protein NLP_2053 [Nostoc sp. 'Lobaria pulmonaria (5183) cyanobiont']